MLRRVATWLNASSPRPAGGWRIAPALLVLLFSLLTLPAGATTHGIRWIVECADCPKYFDELTDRSLRLDTAGHPHITYGGDHLYYAWRDASGWHYETADAAPMVGLYASLALDAAGYPHIGYLDSANEDVKYAYKDAAGWHVETVPGDGA